MSLVSLIDALTIGIRYRRSFRMPVVSGAIVDDVIRNTKSPLGGDFFTRVKGNARGRTLVNDNDTISYLQIDQDNLILRLAATDFEKTFDTIRDGFVPYAEESIFKEFEIDAITRIGLIIHHKVQPTKRLDTIVSGLTGSKVSDPNTINIQFSKKEPFLASAKKGVNDFRNVIYTFSKDNDDMFVDLDFQHHFEPARQDIRDCELQKFLSAAKRFALEDSHAWLKQYAKE